MFWLQPSKCATHSEVILERWGCFYYFEWNVYFPNGFSSAMFEFYRTQRTEVVGWNVIWYRLISTLEREILFYGSMSLVCWHFIHHNFFFGGGWLGGYKITVIGWQLTEQTTNILTEKFLERYFAWLVVGRRTITVVLITEEQLNVKKEMLKHNNILWV